MADNKCKECVRMTVSQDEYISILEEQYEELKKDKEYLDKVNNEQTEVILKLNEQIEKMKNFIFEEIDFCFYCPLCVECENDRGTCPYANTTEEEQKKMLSDWVTK